MTRLSDSVKFYLITILFVLVNSFFIYREFYFISLLPFALGIVLVAFLRIDNFFLLLVFLVPLSIPLNEFVEGVDVNISLPAELLISGGLLLVFSKILLGDRFDSRVLKHPVSVAIYINLVWMLVTAVTSTMFLVSVKYFIARLWFVVIFYFLATQIFKNQKNINRYFWAYIIPLLIVIAYAIGRHLSRGLFDKEAAHYVMNPFYRDHTSYGAILAFLIPVVSGMILNQNTSKPAKTWAILILPLLVFALILSYTRAAWISLIAAVSVLALIRLKVKFVYIIILSGIAGYILFANLSEISYRMEQNRSESSSDLTEHVQSISNITSDYSNVERFNRWKCALRMFEERPVFGWGPGTYMFQYAPFQISREKTPDSTNAGDRGNAHSEYLGPLAESGIMGMLTVILIVVFAIFTGLKVYYNNSDTTIKVLALSVLLGLITYFVHGVFNNFLDTDKASALFWGFIAILVVLDIQTKRMPVSAENGSSRKNNKEG
ncbi:MAG: O-antigen ligase family protein [Bacteroidales bacterium]|nr:O-antigen ligase family protein [Bacteroidales bacterium]